ncbi:MAG: hypothetical protein NTZ86_02855 [Legionellales bacterium]|nr:hypothetical protein [Legionellales bacterium]
MATDKYPRSDKNGSPLMDVKGFLGVFAPYALPFVIAGVCLFAFCKLVKGVYNAWQDANQLAAKSKTASGNKILDTAATYKEKNLSTPRQERDAAKVDMESTQKSIKEELGKLDKVLSALRLPIKEKISELIEEETALKKRIGAQQAIIDSPAAKRTDKKARDSAANTEIGKLQRGVHDNALMQARLTLQLNTYNVTYSTPNVPILSPAIAGVPEIQKITDRLRPLATALPGKVQTHADKENACLAAEKSAEQSRARANKTPDATTAARKSLGEILGDEKETGVSSASRKMGSSGF